MFCDIIMIDAQGPVEACRFCAGSGKEDDYKSCPDCCGSGVEVRPTVALHEDSAFEFKPGQNVRVCDGRRGQIVMRNNAVGQLSPYCVAIDGAGTVWLPEFALTRDEPSNKID